MQYEEPRVTVVNSDDNSLLVSGTGAGQFFTI